jgi:hypothetical protein
MTQRFRFSHSFIALVATVAFLRSDFAIASVDQVDVTDRLESVSCQIPSDDQMGTAQVTVSSQHGRRSLDFELRFVRGAHFKIIDIPVELVILSQAEKNFIFIIQAQPGNENTVRIGLDGNGEAKLQEPGSHFTYPLTNCRVKVAGSTPLEQKSR